MRLYSRIYGLLRTSSTCRYEIPRLPSTDLNHSERYVPSLDVRLSDPTSVVCTPVHSYRIRYSGISNMNPDDLENDGQIWLEKEWFCSIKGKGMMMEFIQSGKTAKEAFTLANERAERAYIKKGYGKRDFEFIQFHRV